MTPRKQHNKARRGSNAVEFALLLPVLVSFMTGIIDYGWFFNQQILMVSAARECARFASLADVNNGDDPETLGLVAASTVLTNAGMTGTLTSNNGSTSGAAPDVVFNCDIQMAYGPLMNLFPAEAYPQNVRASVTMRLENQPIP